VRCKHDRIVKSIGIKRKQTDIISAEKENVKMRCGILGTDTARKLVNTLFYSIGLNLALRAGQGHHNRRIGPNSQLSLHISIDNGRRYLHYQSPVQSYRSLLSQMNARADGRECSTTPMLSPKAIPEG
jgi:hypothetical protein